MSRAWAVFRRQNTERCSCVAGEVRAHLLSRESAKCYVLLSETPQGEGLCSLDGVSLLSSWSITDGGLFRDFVGYQRRRREERGSDLRLLAPGGQGGRTYSELRKSREGEVPAVGFAGPPGSAGWALPDRPSQVAKRAWLGLQHHRAGLGRGSALELGAGGATVDLAPAWHGWA